MEDEKSILDGGLLEINPNVGFDDLMKAWPKESLYWKEEPPLSPESLAIVEDEYKRLSEDVARENLSKLSDRKQRGVIASEGDNR